MSHIQTTDGYVQCLCGYPKYFLQKFFLLPRERKRNIPIFGGKKNLKTFFFAADAAV